MAAPEGARPRAIRLRAYAKVNLGLRVLGRRPDGYHDICTLLQTVSLFDSLTVVLRPGPARVELSCDTPGLQGEANLAWRAADLLLRRTRSAARVSIELRKSVPVGAGLGGGSSDAAATLRALAAMLPQRPRKDQLAEVAAELGSDVPFFLLGGTAVASGRGTRLSPMEDLPPAWLAIARPPVEVSTAWAYGALAADRSRGAVDSNARMHIEPPRPGPDAGRAHIPGLRNDFEPVVLRHFPCVAEVKSRLLAAGARGALMTGTGSAVFGAFNSRELARAAARELCEAGVSAWPACYVGRVASTGRLSAPGSPEAADGTGTAGRPSTGGGIRVD